MKYIEWNIKWNILYEPLNLSEEFFRSFVNTHLFNFFFSILNRDLGIVLVMYVSVLMLVNGNSTRYLIKVLCDSTVINYFISLTLQ